MVIKVLTFSLWQSSLKLKIPFTHGIVDDCWNEIVLSKLWKSWNSVKIVTFGGILVLVVIFGDNNTWGSCMHLNK